MDQSLSFVIDTATEPCAGMDTTATVAAILQVLAADSPDHARLVLIEARAAGLDLATTETVPVLMELIVHALDWLETESLVVPTLNALAALGPDAALAAFDLLFNATFPSGRIEPEHITDAAVVVLARLAAEAGYLDDGLAFFATARGQRDCARYLPLVHTARCHMLGLDGSIAALWPPLLATVDGNPFNPQTWRAMARTCAAVGDWNGALAMLVGGMLLPVPDLAKAGIGTDLAILAIYLHARGQCRLLEHDPRLQPALDTAPAVAAEALGTLIHWPDADSHPLYDADLRHAARAWLNRITAA